MRPLHVVLHDVLDEGRGPERGCTGCLRRRWGAQDDAGDDVLVRRAGRTYNRRGRRLQVCWASPEARGVGEAVLVVARGAVGVPGARSAGGM